VSGQLHARAALPPGKSPRYPFYRRLGGPQSRSGRYGEVKIFYPTETRTAAPPGRPARSQSLYRLSYPGSRRAIDRYFYEGHLLASNFIMVSCYSSTLKIQAITYAFTRLHAVISRSIKLFVGTAVRTSTYPPRRLPHIHHLRRERRCVIVRQ
jgi:hypothetical protein